LAGAGFFDVALGFLPISGGFFEIVCEMVLRERKDEVDWNPESAGSPAGGDVGTLGTTGEQVDDSTCFFGLTLDPGERLLDDWLTGYQVGRRTPGDSRFGQ
jgi:hypothetical protein